MLLSLLTIILPLLLIGYVFYAVNLEKKLKQSHRFTELIANQLVDFANNHLEPAKLANVRNDIKLFLIYQRYSPEGKKLFKARHKAFFNKYEL